MADISYSVLVTSADAIPVPGPVGPSGQSAYSIAVAHGFVGSESAWLASLKGASAYQVWLDQGNSGTADDFLESIEGESAYQAWLNSGNSGTEADFIKAITGPQGDSAYATWLKLGNTGTEAQYIASLTGPKGPSGDSAYTIAVQQGYKGTQTQWVASLQGPPGPSGASTWSQLQGKPTTFPPSPHTHLQSDVTGLVATLNGLAPGSTNIQTGGSIVGGGRLSGLTTISLINDVLNPGPSYFYATDLGSVKRWQQYGSAALLNAPSAGNATSVQVVLGSDTRLTNSRPPLAHALSHNFSGSDPISITTAQISNFPGIVTSSLPGLVPALPNNTTQYFRADGSWSAPPGGGTTIPTPPNTTNTVFRGDAIFSTTLTGLIISSAPPAPIGTIASAQFVLDNLQANNNSPSLAFNYRSASTPLLLQLYVTGTGMGVKNATATGGFIIDSNGTPYKATTAQAGAVPTLPAATGGGASQTKVFLRGDNSWTNLPEVNYLSTGFIVPNIGSTVSLQFYSPYPAWPTVAAGTVYFSDGLSRGFLGIVSYNAGTGILTAINQGNALAGNNVSTDCLIRLIGPGIVSATSAGLVPTPPNNTTTYLRGDGIFATPLGQNQITASNFTIPSVGSSVTITTSNSPWYQTGQLLLISDSSTVMLGEITTVTSGTQITVINRGYRGFGQVGSIGASGTAIVALVGTGNATATQSGLVPVPPNNTSTYLRGDASFSALPVATATTSGLVPTPPNNTTTYLRGDATFAIPAPDKPFRDWVPAENNPPATNYATFGTVNSTSVLQFTNGALNGAVFLSVIPQGAPISTSGVMVRIKWASSLTTGGVIWQVAFERTMAGAINSDHWGTTVAAASTTANASAYTPVETAIIIPYANMSSAVAGDVFRLLIQRQSGDSMAAVALFLEASIESVA